MSVTKTKVCHVDTLAGHFETQFEDLPSDIQALVKAAYWAGDWDTLPPAERIKLAWQYDTPETDGQRLQRQHDLSIEQDRIAAMVPQTITERERKAEALSDLSARIQKTGVLLLQDQLARAERMPTPTTFEQGWQASESARITALIVKAQTAPSDPESPNEAALVSPVSEPEPTPYHLLATPAELIGAFGAFTGMTKTWFNSPKDTPQLLAARHTAGQGGKHFREPLYFVLAVVQWLIDPKRRKGKPMSEATGWRIMENKFPKVYEEYQSLAPDAD